jgi:peptide/nickel transport system substrate-binding protein
MRHHWLIAGLLTFTVLPAPSQAQTIHVALNQDPDVLDPTFSASPFAGHVYAGMCDKLFDLDANVNIVPMLATGYRYDDPTHLILTLRPDVRFQDGEVLDSNAVVYSLNRNITAKASRRALALSPVQSVESVDPLTVRVTLKGASAQLVTTLAGVAGIVVAPKAAETAGDQFGLHPVCAGPFSFDSRVAQDRIVLRRFAGYWNAAAYHFEQVIYLPMTDPLLRLANLRTGNLDLIGFVPPSDLPTVKKDDRLKIMTAAQMSYTGIIFNVGHGARAQSPIGQNVLLRQAFDAALDRKALSDVAFDGMFPPTIQPGFHGSPYYIDSMPPPPRDLAKAKALLQQAGVSLPVPVELMVVNNPWAAQTAEVIQSMVNEAGFDLRIKLTEYATSLQAGRNGDFQGYQIDGGGSVDPDGDFWPFLHTGGASNSSGYSNPSLDKILDDARVTLDIGARRALYAEALEIERQDLPIVYLFNNATIMAMRRNLDGLIVVPDGVIRLKGARLVD